MEARVKIILNLIVVSVFIFLVSVLVFVFALYSEGQQVPPFLSLFLQYHIPFMILMGVFGVAAGLISYSILKSTLEKQKKIVQTNTDIIMKFLSLEDRNVFQVLKEKGGMTTQSEIANLENMTRLKAHRLVKKLEDRGIVHVEKHGKINI